MNAQSGISGDASSGAAFRAIGDSTRRAILDRLAAAELSVSELVAGFEISQPAISRHLRVLREAGLVTRRSNGRERRYALDPAGLRAVGQWVLACRRLVRTGSESSGCSGPERRAQPAVLDEPA